MDIYHNDPDNFIDKMEYFFQYFIWILREHKGTNIQTGAMNKVTEDQTTTCSPTSIF